MKIIINATNMHYGGGRTMLIDLLNSAMVLKGFRFVVFVDPRFATADFKATNIEYFTISVRNRVLMDWKIASVASSPDLILSLANIPPFVRHRSKVVLLLSNRYLIDSYPLKGLGVKTQVRLTAERLIFKWFHANADVIVVQSLVMKDLLMRMGIPEDRVHVLPCKNQDVVDVQAATVIPDSFLYVASGEPHKNHRTLIKAWVLLASEGIRPRLYLTIDRTTSFYPWIADLMSKHDLKIELLERLPRKDLLAFYPRVSAIVYPSFFECYGLPLLEAKAYDVPIVASELDYVRDQVEPAETFDPHSARSIARALKRFMKRPEGRYPVVSAETFITEISSWVH